jgi:hypothetical protein
MVSGADPSLEGGEEFCLFLLLKPHCFLFAIEIKTEEGLEGAILAFPFLQFLL